MIKRKILFVAPYPPPYSGPETSAKLFMESKIHDFYEVNLFDTNFRKSNADKGKLGISAILIFFKCRKIYQNGNGSENAITIAKKTINNDAFVKHIVKN